ncbi:F-type conjugative transfer protein TrbC [Morganella psychrotolerans]|uniref:F-type conjugative transfer protein TrbC n=1 Tax=Morganella psychrotolerans TaxID=368603 RepID=UPI0039B0FFC8
MAAHDYGIKKERVSRRIYHSELSLWLMSPAGLGIGLLCFAVLGWIYPVSLWISTPLCVFWSPIMLLETWLMPMRMPSDMNRRDPSTKREIPGKMFGFLPMTVIRVTMKRAAGILYLGYLRGRDAGRELWLSMDDMTRHIIMFGTTGAGKTETLLGFVFNQLGFGRGLIYSDAKAQNDVALSIASLARRYGREDDLRMMNFITGGRSRAQELLEDIKHRPQTNSINAFGIAEETYIINLMDSMLPPAGNDGGWQEKARSMIQALVFALVYKTRKEGTVMSQRVIQSYLPLKNIADLYIQSVVEQWHEEARLPVENYLKTLAGFDLSKVDSPSEWSPEALNQHGYLIQQFTRMLALFNDTYGHVFARDAGDIDLRDVVHNDRILTILIPALELSSSEAATLGRLYVSQLAMILSQDLGEKLEGKPEDIMIIRKFRDRFPFLWIVDEVGACYTEKLGELATQVRSLDYCLLLAGQDVQRLKSAAGDKIWTLIANMGTRITGKILDPKDTLEILQLMAGTEYVPAMDNMVRQAGVMGTVWNEGDRLSVREQKKITVEEVQQLQEGENIILFRGEVTRSNALYIPDTEKHSRERIQINRFIEVEPPSLDDLLSLSPSRKKRSFPRQEGIQGILRTVFDDNGSKFDDLRLIDPILSGLIGIETEWTEIWQHSPGTAVKTTLLWEAAGKLIKSNGYRYTAQQAEPRALKVGLQTLVDYQTQHVTRTPK